jgi:hypothetical protein
MKKSLLSFITICFFGFGLSNCNVTGEESFSFRPGDSLTIIGPAEVTIPEGVSSAQASYYVQAFTINKDYSWSVEGAGNAQQDSVYRQGEFMDVSFSEEGSYTVSIDNGEYQGSLDVSVVNTN